MFLPTVLLAQDRQAGPHRPQIALDPLAKQLRLLYSGKPSAVPTERFKAHPNHRHVTDFQTKVEDNIVALSPVKFGIGLSAMLLHLVGTPLHLRNGANVQVNHSGIGMGQKTHCLQGAGHITHPANDIGQIGAALCKARTPAKPWARRLSCWPSACLKRCATLWRKPVASQRE